MTTETKTRRIALRALQPGQKLIRVEPKTFVGPRGSRYEFLGIRSRFGGRAVTFSRSTLSPSGKTRTFHFDGALPFEIDDNLSCKLVAEIVDETTESEA
jgi:hypothetical protein